VLLYLRIRPRLMLRGVHLALLGCRQGWLLMGSVQLPQVIPTLLPLQVGLLPCGVREQMMLQSLFVTVAGDEPPCTAPVRPIVMRFWQRTCLLVGQVHRLGPRLRSRQRPRLRLWHSQLWRLLRLFP